jgi:hypothetical protein
LCMTSSKHTTFSLSVCVSIRQSFSFFFFWRFLSIVASIKREKGKKHKMFYLACSCFVLCGIILTERKTTFNCPKHDNRVISFLKYINYTNNFGEKSKLVFVLNEEHHKEQRSTSQLKSQLITDLPS